MNPAATIDAISSIYPGGVRHGSPVRTAHRHARALHGGDRRPAARDGVGSPLGNRQRRRVVCHRGDQPGHCPGHCPPLRRAGGKPRRPYRTCPDLRQSQWHTDIRGDRASLPGQAAGWHVGGGRSDAARGGRRHPAGRHHRHRQVLPGRDRTAGHRGRGGAELDAELAATAAPAAAGGRESHIRQRVSRHRPGDAGPGRRVHACAGGPRRRCRRQPRAARGPLSDQRQGDDDPGRGADVGLDARRACLLGGRAG